ncbi:Panacea domain-containing protein [Acinetobacter baumannii]|uniref:Panacea domain-containing protein n=1 Tax=Acinetobacter baumannii TaxID=470 RepID=UPI000BBCBFE7|nr:type II toxin-antitoxin system antitoxin SocA domain-containing protein [Acinetobacter baumannii]MDC4317713.1 DUF4065 domain-containing protein [Acinetobacter baumannii]MDC5495567.1 DUF4065 domain-containing protein [Acinetobacter baumannii]MDC5509758.1 DUF4065 domain-containing protein [Acinetobacter baumannii]MDH2526739.1 DUF4065 domain-containing protein [Acinetobacter baumannii]PCE47855.1 hypothetical protein CO267_02810 [Acinetobacter baumannii]
MAHTALQVANRIIELGRTANPSQYYTPMQLLKLVYIAHGWMLGICNTPLIKEQVQAWKYGPVIPDLYQSVKKYGSNPIFDEKVGSFWESQTSDFTADENAIIQYVVDSYGSIDGITLSQITHAPDTPWSATFNHSGWGDVIPTDLIANHYRLLLDKVRRNASTPT